MENLKKISVMSHTSVPNSILTVPLPPAHRITLHYFLPPFLHLIVYAFELASSIALCWSLYNIKIPLFTGITAFLAFLPALVTTAALLICGSKETRLIKRLAFAIVTLMAFPFWAIYRLSYRIFWSVEAMLILHRQGNASSEGEIEEGEWGRRGSEIEEALANSMEPSSAELYLFLRAFLYSLPNLLLQSWIIIAGLYDIVKGYETCIVQTASILISLVYLSMTAAYYQSFESQRLLGRNFPWRGKKKKVEEKEYPTEDKTEKKVGEKNEPGIEMMSSLPQMTEENQTEENRTEENRTEENRTEENRTEENQTEENRTEENRTEENQTGEKQTEDNQTKENSHEEEELMKHHSPPSSPTSTESSPRVTLRRALNLSEVGTPGTYRGFYLPIPNEPAPPPPKVRSPRVPGGFKDIFCDSDSSVTSPRVSRDQSFRSTLFGWSYTWRPNRLSTRSTDPPLPHSPVPQGVFPALPVPTHRKDPPKRVALERDDAMGLCVSFCSWFFLLSARMLTLGNAIYFFMKPTIGLCAAHVLVVTLWLLRREGRPYLQPRKLFLRFALAITSVSGLLLELGVIPFKMMVPLMHSALIFVEDLGLGLGWMLFIDRDSWWSSYAFYSSLGSHFLYFSCAVIYTIALRPKKHILPPESSLVEQEVTY